MTKLILVLTAFVAIASATSTGGFIQKTAAQQIADGKAMARNKVQNAKE